MPIYMDRHDGENLTPEAVAEAHAADIKLQDKYNCKFIGRLLFRSFLLFSNLGS